MKNAWEELTPSDFVKVSSLLKSYRKGEFDFSELRIRLVPILAGLRINEIMLRIRNKKDKERVWENIYHLSLKVNFFFWIDYEDKKAFARLPRKLQGELLKNFPEDIITDPDELDPINSLKRQIRIDLEIKKNLMPEMIHGRYHYPGYTFEIINDIPRTSLSARQFSEAHRILSQYLQNESEDLLSMLCATLYQKEYSAETTKNLTKYFLRVSYSIKDAVILNFIGINNFIARRTKYSVLFEPSVKSITDTSFGFESNICLLSWFLFEGNRPIENVNLFRFLDELINELKN
jgi:hypothetical protein